MVAKGGGVFTAWPQGASEACAKVKVRVLVHLRLQALTSQNKRNDRPLLSHVWRFTMAYHPAMNSV